MTNTNDLSENQFITLELLPATTDELADSLDRSVSYVYDLVSGLRQKGYDIQQDEQGRYYRGDEVVADPASYIAETRKASGEKQAITRKANALLAEMEYHLTEKLNASEPAISEEYNFSRDGGQHLVIPRGDDHFGEHITNQDGDDTFNSDIAEGRLRTVFDRALGIADMREDAGVSFDGAGLLMCGDHVTNDAIYEGQPHDTDETVREQIERTADIYLEQIKRLSSRFPDVTVACQVGNHGRLGDASVNADGIVFAMLDRMVRESDMDNVTFIQSDRSYYVDLTLRDYAVHMRHGHDSSLEHIGTSAGKQRWLSWLVDHEFDVAFRGHYHMVKEEPINGVPVHMIGSLVPQTEFEESHAISGRAAAAVHGMTDRAPTEWTERVYFDG
jgi:biotin operon repressor